MPVRFLLAALLLSACASNHGGHSACDEMDREVQQKEKVDAKVKFLRKKVAADRRANDTTSAAADQQTLGTLLDYQRDLKESLDQNSQDCKPSFYEGQLPSGNGGKKGE